MSYISNACAFEIEPGAKANVYLANANYLKSGQGRAGLEVPDGANVVITSADGDTMTTGTLEAYGSSWGGAGIGGPGYEHSPIQGRAGIITINGGTVVAYGARGGAGIGGGNTGGHDGGGNITINGGSITAIGGDGPDSGGGAGIGSGYNASYPDTTNGDDGTKITITGGIIEKAQGGSGSAGIGGSIYSASGVIRIATDLKEMVEAAAVAGSSSAENIGHGSLASTSDVEYVDNLVFEPGEVPDRIDIVRESKILKEKEVEVTRSIPRFTESSRTVEITPSPSYENTIENKTLGSSIDDLSAKSLPAGSSTVTTAASPLTSKSYQLTGSYGTDPSSLITLATGAGSLSTNANILFEVTSVDESAGTVTLKAIANLMATDGTVTKRIVRENIILTEESHCTFERT